jgi:type III pantothenate kinase
MILCIDCGNTRLKWGVHEGAGWLAQGTLDYTELGTLAERLRAAPRAGRAVVANVAGVAVGEAVAAALAPLGIRAQAVRACAEQCGVRNLYERPEQLGADRWAALIGARQLHAGPCLVVCAGTATTVDLLDAGGNFQGGLILPGMELMRRALAQNTAGLPLAEGRYALQPRNTQDAITSGCLQAQAGAVERMFAQVAGAPDALCMVSGGAAAAFYDLLRLPKRAVENLVLEGLARIGRACP